MNTQSEARLTVLEARTQDRPSPPDPHPSTLASDATSGAGGEAAPGSRTTPPVAETRATRALVVDDSEAARTQVEKALRGFGLVVDTAASGEEALRSITRHRYGIVVLDVLLPDLDGYRVCRAIKRDRSIGRTPVVLLTTRSAPLDRMKGSLAGADAYLAKPIAREAFEQMIQKYLIHPGPDSQTPWQTQSHDSRLPEVERGRADDDTGQKA